MLSGAGASNGIGIGKALIFEERSLEYTPMAVTDNEAESRRFKDAVEIFCKNTFAKAEAVRSSAGEKEAEILESHISIIKDPYLNGEIEKLIDDGQCAEAALEQMCDLFITMFSSAEDELTRQRASDVAYIKAGVLRALLGIEDINISDAPHGTVLVVHELTPSMAADIVKENIVGIVTETGGKTSHSAILARALEIPAVLGVERAIEMLADSKQVIVDGCEGEVIPNPDEKQLEAYLQKRDSFLSERRELENYRGRKTLSASGEEYQLFCNIGKPEDALKAKDADGEGVGLFRTEFLFMDRNSAPTEDEQFQAYKRAAIMLEGKPLVIRTLDIGGDKALPYLGLETEENPYMGFRAIRFCLKNRELFKTQLKAILRASTFGDVRIMLPLVTTVDELRNSRQLVEEAKLELREAGVAFDEGIKTGVMIETSSAAVIADLLAQDADFFSIGTNDLTGYTMACDRGNSNVSYLYSALQPSVLRLIKNIIECGVRNNIPVGMCGEAAANPMMIPLLISFGLTEFSVAPPSVLRARKTISQWTKNEADEVAARVMSLATQKEIEAYLKTVI